MSQINERPDLKEKLSPEQYRVACQCGTEPPFQNEYWDHKQRGIYLDVISGRPLFSSAHKFDSGSGWPSFYQALDPEEVIEVTDESHGMVRTEVRSKSGEGSEFVMLLPVGSMDQPLEQNLDEQ